MGNGREVKRYPGGAVIDDREQLLLMMFCGLAIQSTAWFVFDEIIINVHFHAHILAGHSLESGMQARPNNTNYATTPLITFASTTPVNFSFRPPWKYVNGL